PPVSAEMDLAGGRLVAAAFHDYREDFFKPEQVDIVREALTEISRDEVDEVCHEEIISKMELLTY
ncbi:hypothetical protein, partial [Huaxiibacter chinensis]|uniref:hypothetical protein n=1 Tax=Huaxiibacter chinensis TaxID=2899785 RepID=UPI003D3157CA